jgi:IPT/TIG domain
MPVTQRELGEFTHPDSFRHAEIHAETARPGPWWRGNTAKAVPDRVDTELQNHCRERRKTMLRLLGALALVVAVMPGVCAGSRDPGPTPLIKVVQPDSAKPGDEVTVSGTNLAKETVAAVYLTLGEKTIKVKVTSQTDTDVKFMVPADLKSGRFGIMVLTTGGDDAREIDEPVFLSVE